MNASNLAKFYVVGGTVPPEAPSYIERRADTELYERLRRSEFCYVLTPRQMGKSSLMARTARRLRNQQIRVAILDLTQIGTTGGKSAAAQWYYGVARRIHRELKISSDLQSWWRGRGNLPPVQRLLEFLSDIALPQTGSQLVIFIDEIDSTIPLPFGSDFFAAIRACHNERANKGDFRRLTFVLLGVASPSDLIADLRRTPFNVGHRIDLDDFSNQEAQPLARVLLGDEADRQLTLDRVIFWTGGHPYLTQRALAEISALQPFSANAVERVVDSTIRRIFIDPAQHQADQNIAYVRRYLNEEAKLTDELRAIFHKLRYGDFVEDDPLSPGKSALKLSGLLKIGGNGQLVIRNRIYEQTLQDWEAGASFSKQGNIPAARPLTMRDESLRYSTAKVVLLGDSGVGKTGLGWRLASDEFKTHVSTHGLQFWRMEQLGSRKDGVQCEAILWDFAGQADYRLIHQLFLDDANLALVLFDPTRGEESLRGVQFWLEKIRLLNCNTILVAARSDRGSSQVSSEEIGSFCHQYDVSSYIAVSAMAGWGMDELRQKMRDLIPWQEIPTRVVSATFRKVRNYVLDLKANARAVVLRPKELRQRLVASDPKWKFSDEEMMAAVGHLANEGLVRLVKTSLGEPRVLLSPELLNNLAASFVLEARRNVKGLGALEELRLLSGGYPFPEMNKMSEAERAILLDSTAALFLEHNVCFRETDLVGTAYLVFPELINLKRPIDDGGEPIEDGAAYTATGAVENVYASLVALMGYTKTFTRTNQWRNHARYEVGRGQVCGFRLEGERAGELDFVLYFGTDTPVPVRILFQSLFENFLARRNLTVRRFDPVACRNGHPLNRVVLREQLALGAESTFCSRCGEKIVLPQADQPIQLSKRQADEVESIRRAADERSLFEQVLFRLKTYVTERKLPVPECFISYAWGTPEHELWVERSLASDLQKAGVSVVLDRWENVRIGASVPRFVERAGKCDRVIVVGTPLYRKKYENDEPMGGFVVMAEGDLVGKRMIGTEAKKESVLPLLLEGTEETALPHLLRGRVHADFRNPENYFSTMLDLLLSLFAIKPQEPVAVDLRASLAGRTK